MICYGQELARKSHQDSAVRFVTAKRGPERATETRQYDLLRPRVWPERATQTRQYDLLRPRVGQKEPPRLGSTICYGQTWARKSHRDSAVRFVTAKSLARKSHQDSAIRFATSKSCPERATKTRQYDLLRPRIGQKEPPRLGSTICYGQELARKSRQDVAVRLVTAKRGPERVTETRQYVLLRPRVWPERATKTRQYDLLRPRVGQKEPPRLGSTICYGQELRATNTRQCDLLRPIVGQKKPPRLGGTICYGKELSRKSHQDSAVRFVTAKHVPERATKTRQYDLLRPRVGQKSHQDSAVRFVTAKSWQKRTTETRQYDLLRPNVGQKEPPRLGSTMCYGQEWARKSHQDSVVRFVIAKRGPERTTKTRQYDLLRPRVGQKEPPRLGSTTCYGRTWARKSHQDSAVRFVTAKSCPERATKTRQYDLLRPRVDQKEPPRLGSTICYGQTWARKSHHDSAVRFVTTKTWLEKATESHQDSAALFPNVGELARKSHQDSAVQFVTAKSWPERAAKTRQYDLLRPNVGQKESPRLGRICYGQEFGQKKPPRLGSTICYGQELAIKSHQDSAVRFVTTKRGSERATETRQYDLLRPRVGQKEPPRLRSTICYGQELARKSHQDSAVRFVTAKS